MVTHKGKHMRTLNSAHSSLKANGKMSESSSDSGATGKECELPSSPGPRLTQGTQSGSDLSRDGAKDGRDDGALPSTSSEGSSTVMVAVPPRGSGKKAGLQEIALTGSEALDVLDQVCVCVFVFVKDLSACVCMLASSPGPFPAFQCCTLKFNLQSITDAYNYY